MIASLPKLRLRSWLAIALSSALLPVLVLAVFQTISGLERESQRRIQQLLSESQYTADRIEFELDRVGVLVSALASDTPGTDDCAMLLDRLSELVPSTTLVFRAKPTGDLVCASPDTLGETISVFPKIDDFSEIKKTVRAEAMFGVGSNAYIVGIVTALMNGSDVEELISVSLDIGQLAEIAAGEIRSDEIRFGLVNNDGVVFDHPVLEQVPIDEIKASQVDDRILLSNNLDGRYNAVARRIEGTGLYAVSYRPAPSWWSIISSQPIQIAFIPALAFIAVFLAIWWAIESLVLKWLRRLQRVSDIYGAGRLGLTDEETISKAPLEVASLAEGLDGMADRIAKRQEELQDALSVRDAAIKETHHRVKNNLQIVSSFLNLEARNAEFEETRSVLQKARNRISALSIVHQTLYQHERVAEVQTKPFLDLLLTHLKSALLMEDNRIELVYDIDDALISSDDANPLALLILELITNSVKHAFDENGGRIDVRFKQFDDRFELSVSDTGIGARPDHDREGTGGRLMKAFVRQLGGQLSLETDQGRCTTVVIPIQ